MRIGKTILNLEDLSEEDLSIVITEAKRLRGRKIQSRDIDANFVALLARAKEEGFSICSKYTGEILKAEDWVVYDDELNCLHQGEWIH